MVLSAPFVSFSKPVAHPYASVPASDEETSLVSQDDKESQIQASSKPIFFDPSVWLSAFAVLSIAITIWNLLVIQLHSQETRFSTLEASIGSPYNGLERLERNESSPSWPLSSIHYPDFVGAAEGPYIRHGLKNGSTVQLGSERTIVVQHRVRDYGLEQCALEIRFSHSAEHRVMQAVGHTGKDPRLTLWRIEGQDNKAVFASSAFPVSLPPRKELLSNTSFEDSRSLRSSFFRCNAGSILTLEIALDCSSDACMTEFSLSRSPKYQGFWIVQSE